MQGNAKCLAQVQVNDVRCSSLIHKCCNSNVERLQICHSRFALSEDTLSVTSQAFVFHML